MTCSVFDPAGKRIAHGIGAASACNLVQHALPGTTIRRGLVVLYCHPEAEPATPALLEHRAGRAIYPHTYTKRITSWQDATLFARLLRWFTQSKTQYLCRPAAGRKRTQRLGMQPVYTSRTLRG